SMERTRSFSSWLFNVGEAFTGETFAANLVEEVSRDWWFFTMTQSEVQSTAEQPVPFPAQDLQLICMSEFAESMDLQRSQLFRYELGSETWIDEFSSPGM